ncbi:hypothetical protein MRX96_047611 [Rhipicephalus microplus]
MSRSRRSHQGRVSPACRRGKNEETSSPPASCGGGQLSTRFPFPCGVAAGADDDRPLCHNGSPASGQLRHLLARDPHSLAVLAHLRTSRFHPPPPSSCLHEATISLD